MTSETGTHSGSAETVVSALAPIFGLAFPLRRRTILDTEQVVLDPRGTPLHPHPRMTDVTDTGNAETILVVEDEDAIRQVAARVLSRLGYTVIAASSGEAALSEAHTLGRPVDLLLADMVMPGMTGPELAKRLREIQPDLRVLFTSGYSVDDVTRQFGLSGIAWSFIPKPYSLSSLTQEVRRVLDTRPEAVAPLEPIAPSTGTPRP